MTITLNATTIGQILVWVVAFTAQIVDQVPPRWKPAVLIVSAAASTALHQLSGRRNPNGTPAALPYVKKEAQGQKPGTF